MRVVFDTNVLVSALALPGGRGDEALRRIVAGEDSLALSGPILDELLSVLSRKFGYEREQLARVAVFLSEVAVFVQPSEALAILADEPDNRVLECALAADARVIVTGDRAMLAQGEFRRIPIVSLATYLAGAVQGRRTSATGRASSMNDRTNILQIDDDRLWDTMMASARIGPGRDQGLRRLALDESDKEMRDVFVAWCRDAGASVTVDRMGNIFARRAGRDDAAAPVLVGSHLDTQYTGGKFDGILGVLAGLEIIRTLEDHDIETRRPIEVVNWSNEEGARFNPPMLASAVFAGVRDLEWAYARTDNDGVTYGSALAEIGYVGDTEMGGRDIDAYFELHIEQGPILEAEGVAVGVVTHGYATRGMRLRFEGETAHSGPTPMDQRRNALVGAAYLIAAVNDIGWKYHGEGGKSTASQIAIWPNAVGILPEFAQVSIDFRHPEVRGAERMLADVEAAIEDCATGGNVDCEIVDRWRFGDERFDPDCVQLVRDAADDLGIRYLDMQSQAGHDAYNMTHVCPTALIFCPCEKGITHNEAENVAKEDAVPSVNVLLHAVLARANR